MKHHFITLLLIIFGISNAISAQDSLFFYKGGKIKYSTSTSNIDSVSLHAPALYPTLRSSQVVTYLETNKGTSTFGQMIRIAGLADSLDNKTIWAPDNSKLTNINLSDVDLVRRIVRNHIAPTIINAPLTANSTKILMMNNKRIAFAQSGSTTLFDTATVQLPGIYVAKSLIYSLNGYIPYRLNGWEYLFQSSGHNLFTQYILSHNTTTNGSTTNDLLAHIPNISNEDSVTSIIAPTDELYTIAYNRLYPYCKSTSVANQEEATKFALFHNNFFNKAISSNSANLTSTSATNLGDATTLLKDAQHTKLSNGEAFLLSDSTFYSAAVLQKEIIIEAENNRFGQVYSNYSASTLQRPDSNSISNRAFQYLTDISTSSISTVYVQYPIPNTYARKYNIYCVFVPGSYINSSDSRPYKVKFTLTYPNSSGGTTTAFVTAANGLSTTSSAAGTFTTNGKTLQKMLVASNVDLPVCNLFMSSAKTPSVILKITNATAKTTSEMASYNRNIAIDCIVFEPVP